MVKNALKYPGIKICYFRKSYAEVLENAVRPLQKWLPPEIYTYNSQEHTMKFYNGSMIQFCNAESLSVVETKYQGLEANILCVEESLNLPEDALKYLFTMVRTATNKFPSQIRMTGNPYGCSFAYHKRVFIDRNFIIDKEHPELSENPDEYTFIQALATDNTFLMENSPSYLAVLNALPERLRLASLYGEWNECMGRFFQIFTRKTHTYPDFAIPQEWKKYVTFDAGLDQFACLWFAVDTDNRIWVYREFSQPNLTINQWAKAITDNTMRGETIEYHISPPDMRRRSADTGKSYQQILAENGVTPIFADNSFDRGAQIMQMMMLPKELKDEKVKSQFAEPPAKLPMLMVSKSCKKLIECLEVIGTDPDKPNRYDVKSDHSLSHLPDALRYGCITMVEPSEVEMNAPEKSAQEAAIEDLTDQDAEDMFGLETDATLLLFGRRTAPEWQ